MSNHTVHTEYSAFTAAEIIRLRVPGFAPRAG